MENLQENVDPFNEQEEPSYSSPQDEHYYDQYNDASPLTFCSSYLCYPLSRIGKDHLEQGDQIIMPQSALLRLMDLQVKFPMVFEIRNDAKGRVSHCGVYEFTAEEGSVFLPIWMTKNLKLQEGGIFTLKSASLEKGTYVKLQPHSADFLDILNPKAALEETLSSKFFCLTTGDTIKINYNSKDFVIDIAETRPSSAVCILDTDCEVDFDPSLDYKEPVKPTKQVKEVKESGYEERANSKFIPFTGLARRLDGSYSSSSLQENKQTVEGKNKETESELRSRKRPAKVVSGSSDANGTPKEPQNKIAKTETPKKESFQPFTGTKYSLAG